MSQYMIQRLVELPIEDISCLTTSQILDFYGVDGGASAGIGLFQPSDNSQLQHHHHLLFSPDVSSSSPTTAVTPSSPFCCYGEVVTDGCFSPFPSLDPAELSAILDALPPFSSAGPESDLVQAAGYDDCSSSSTSSTGTGTATAAVASSDLAPAAMLPVSSSSFPDHFKHIMLEGVTAGGYASHSGDQVVPAAMGHYQRQQVASAVAYEEDPRYAGPSVFLQHVPGFMGLEAAAPRAPPYGFFEGEAGAGMGRGFDRNGGAQGFIVGEIMAATDVGEYLKGGLGFYGRSDLMQQSYSYGNLQQVIGGIDQHLMSGSSSSSATLSATDISTGDESTFKVGRLSVEERREKIHRYMKKRNERNFSKKIKYACRKTLADSRPRVRGRFAKNDEFCEATMATSSNHEYDDEEEGTPKGEDILDSSDILAHISGVNSFRYNYNLESWV